LQKEVFYNQTNEFTSWIDFNKKEYQDPVIRLRAIWQDTAEIALFYEIPL